MSVLRMNGLNILMLPYYIIKRFTVFTGALLMLLGLFVCLSLISYDHADPSLNRETIESVHNMMGYTGAVWADILLQVLGLGAVLLPVCLFSWAWRLLGRDVITFFWLRLCGMCGAMVCATLIFEVLPLDVIWPFGAGAGGAMGELLMRLFGDEIAVHMIIALMALGGVVMLMPFAMGLKRQEWQFIAGVCIRCLAYLHALAYTMIGLFRSQPQKRGGASSVSTTRKRPQAKPKATSMVTKTLDKPEAVEPPRMSASQSKVMRGGKPSAKQGVLELRQQEGYELPPHSLLSPGSKVKRAQVSDNALTQNAKLLASVLQDFGINGEIINIRPGPVVTLYELEPSPGTKSSRVIGLADDIARSMSAISARIAVIPGRNAIGIELPNSTRETVYLRDVLEDSAFSNSKAGLPLALGRDIGGDPNVVDLAKMPHLLVAGTTGSGKSVAVNTMIMSLVYRLTPDQCRFIMIDPKMLELSIYDGIPHLLSPVVTDPSKAVVALKWAVKEMENRYRLMATLGVRNIDGYNKRIKEAARKGETLKREVQTGFDPNTGKPVMEDQLIDMQALPFIVVIVDEMADLMLVAGKDIEGSIQRLAQMARAAGIHLIMATQRPSVDVITGVIKANFPTRISFQVTSKIDSRTILGEQGAEQLLGQGDMLYMAGGGRITRVHGPFVSDEEVEHVVAHLKAQGTPEYIESITLDDEPNIDGGEEDETEEERALYDQAVGIVLRDKKASTSYLQRCLKIGYNRAARLIDKMEREGVVGPANHVGKREVLR